MPTRQPNTIIARTVLDCKTCTRAGVCKITDEAEKFRCYSPVQLTPNQKYDFFNAIMQSTDEKAMEILKFVAEKSCVDPVEFAHVAWTQQVFTVTRELARFYGLSEEYLAGVFSNARARWSGIGFRKEFQPLMCRGEIHHLHMNHSRNPDQKIPPRVNGISPKLALAIIFAGMSAVTTPIQVAKRRVLELGIGFFKEEEPVQLESPAPHAVPAPADGTVLVTPDLLTAIIRAVVRESVSATLAACGR